MKPPIPDQNHRLDEKKCQLGNFDKIWEFLGSSADLPPPIVSLDGVDPLSNSPLNDTDLTELTDIGADLTTTKGVRWRDEVEGADLADNDENYDLEALPKLSKAKKKKLRRKRKNGALKARTAAATSLSSGSEIDSEPEQQKTLPPYSRQSVIRRLLFEESDGTAGANTSLPEPAKARHSNAHATEWPVANPQSFLRSSVRRTESKSSNAFAEASARKSKLITNLREQFVDERPYLENIGLLTSEAVITDVGLHVFVDASNVFPLLSSF